MTGQVGGKENKRPSFRNSKGNRSTNNSMGVISIPCIPILTADQCDSDNDLPEAP